jgi:hypothetical protein
MTCQREDSESAELANRDGCAANNTGRNVVNSAYVRLRGGAA